MYYRQVIIRFNFALFPLHKPIVQTEDSFEVAVEPVKLKGFTIGILFEMKLYCFVSTIGLFHSLENLLYVAHYYNVSIKEFQYEGR